MNVFDILESPPLLHAIIVHFPIALGILGIPLVFLTALVDTDRNVLRWLSVGCYVVLVGGALAALASGERARDRVPNTLSPQVYELIEHHEEMGEKVWIPAAATAVFLVLSVMKARWFRKATMLCAMLSSLACAGLVSLTGHYGGTIVHHYGVSGAIMLNADGTPPGEPPAIALPKPAEEKTEPAAVEPPAGSDKDEGVAEPATAPTETEDAGRPEAAAQAPAKTEEAPAEPDSSAETPTDIAAAPMEEKPAVPEVSYTASVAPIFATHCTGCHARTDPAGGLSLTSVSAMEQSGKKGGPGVVPGKPDESVVIKYVLGELQPQMPLGKDPLSKADIETLRNWIEGGAKDDSPAEGRP